MNKNFKYLFLLIFFGNVFCGDMDNDDDWKEISREINASLDTWTKEIAYSLEMAKIQDLIKNLQSINKEYDSQIFLDIRGIFSNNKPFIEKISEEHIQLFLYCIDNKFSKKVSTASMNFLNNMRKKKNLSIREQDKENNPHNQNAESVPHIGPLKEHPAIRRIKEEEL